jgi:UDP-sugar pyrophosphorylase
MHVTSACMQISLPVDTASGMCFLECYIQNILALQRRSGAKRPLQLAIMTSDDTHEATQKLLEAGGHFGARASQVHLIKQGRVPCFINPAGHLALHSHDPYMLEVKPHGHGDVHALLHQSGLAKRWHSSGVKWLAFFQDTNAMVFRGLLPTLGAPPEAARSAACSHALCRL